MGDQHVSGENSTFWGTATFLEELQRFWGEELHRFWENYNVFG